VELLQQFHSKPVIVFAMASIAIATLATNIAANVVSPANDFANLAPRFIGFRIGGFMTGLVGIAIMPWYLYNDPSGYIFTWLIGSSSLLGAVGGVIICDYWILRRARLSIPDLFNPNGKYRYDRGFNWCAILAAGIGIVPVIPGFIDTVSHGALLRPDTPIAAIVLDLYNYSWFVTFGVSFIVYAFLMIANPATSEALEGVGEPQGFEPVVIDPVPSQ
jgi:NCS1 family nucleobase:cation symporter-1